MPILLEFITCGCYANLGVVGRNSVNVVGEFLPPLVGRSHLLPLKLLCKKGEREEGRERPIWKEDKRVETVLPMRGRSRG